MRFFLRSALMQVFKLMRYIHADNLASPLKLSKPRHMFISTFLKQIVHLVLVFGEHIANGIDGTLIFFDETGKFFFAHANSHVICQYSYK